MTKYSDLYLAFLFFCTFVEMVEGELDILGKSGREDVLVDSELMSALSDDGVYDVQAGDFVLRPTLLDEFLHTLDDMLVEFDGFDCPLGDAGHLGLGDRRLQLVQRRELPDRNRKSWVHL